MDYGDSPEEGAFRDRLRRWLAEDRSWSSASSTDDEYWIRQASWHTALFEAGFFALAWPKKWGGQELHHTFEVIVDEELARAGAPPKPSLGYLIQGISRFGSEELCDRFIPGLISGRDRWCQGFSEPDAGSDLASLQTTAVLDGDEYVIEGHKIWTSYSDVAEWCLLLARTDPDVPKHRGLSVFAIPMNQSGIEQRPLRMINGVSNEFGQVTFDGARVTAENLIGEPGQGWALAMTIVAFERQPAELGYVARYAKTVSELEGDVRSDPDSTRREIAEHIAWAHVQSEMLRLHVCRRLSERLDDPDGGVHGSIDKLLMTWTEQSVGQAARHAAGSATSQAGGDPRLKTYLYSRSQSVMGGTSQIQKNIIATRVLGLPSN